MRKFLQQFPKYSPVINCHLLNKKLLIKKVEYMNLFHYYYPIYLILGNLNLEFSFINYLYNQQIFIIYYNFY